VVDTNPSFARNAERPVPPGPQSEVRLGRTPHAKRDDAWLVAAVLAGDEAAARAIFERHAPIVRRCLRASFEGVDLDDGVQAVFVRCFEYLTRLREPSSLRSFIVGIALRLGAMERRRRHVRCREHLTASGELPELAGFDDSLESLEVAARTREILSRLSPEASQALELRFIHEKELTEIADTMGVSLATTKRHLVRVASRLRAMARNEPTLAEYLRHVAGT
jgi:RNA polymerase sigma-70 factor (ECF subfamily)